MKLFSSKTHGYLDYLVGILLIVSPWAFGFYRGGIESWVPLVLGVFTVLYSLLTNYELGVARGIGMTTHLGLDVLSGIFLAMSPWIFGFANQVYIPHLTVGIIEILVATFTQHVAFTPLHREQQQQQHHHAVR